MESYWLFIEILLRFSYILVISSGYILFICSCQMNEEKFDKLLIIAINFVSKLIQGDKNMVFFAQLYENSTDCFVLEVLTMSSFQNRICIEIQEKENKILYIASNQEIGVVTVDS